MIGRSHGIHAEPVSFGLKLAGFYAEFDRARTRHRSAGEIATCKIQALSAPMLILTLLLKPTLLNAWG